MRIFIALLFISVLPLASFSQDKKALKGIEQEMVEDSEKDKKGGLFGKKDKKESTEAGDKKSKKKSKKSSSNSSGTVERMVMNLDAEPSERVFEKRQKLTEKEIKQAMEAREEKSARDYEKSVQPDRGTFRDKYGRNITSGPRYSGDSKIRKINSKNRKRRKNTYKKQKQRSRRTYRYD